MTLDDLRLLMYQTLLDLATEEGINASSKEEIYGCIFGRDSAITILKLLRVYKRQQTSELLAICRRTLITLTALQGTEFNIQSGEEPGKFIHEFRKEPKQYERLVQGDHPFYIYPDGVMRLYDSIDATPLTLIALYRYWEVTQDHDFLLTVLPAVERGLNWIITFGDRDKDFLIEYEFPSERQYGGLSVQSWTDSGESLRQIDNSFPEYPIAPVEAQGFAWLAMKLWADFYRIGHVKFSQKLEAQARSLKEQFNKNFLCHERNSYRFAAQALDGKKRQIKTVTANPLLCLWASYGAGDSLEAIVDGALIDDFVARVFEPDMFDVDAGIRTMSTLSPTYNPNQDSYHNGSFWTVLNGLIHEGLQMYERFEMQANLLFDASIKPLLFFGTPIELCIRQNGTYLEYRSASGQVSCRYQAWSAACALDWLTQGLITQPEQSKIGKTP